MSGSAQPPAELCRNIACKVLLGEATWSTGALS